MEEVHCTTQAQLHNNRPPTKNLSEYTILIDFFDVPPQRMPLPKLVLLAEQRFHRSDATEKSMQVYLDSGFQERNEETETKQEEVLAIA